MLNTSHITKQTLILILSILVALIAVLLAPANLDAAQADKDGEDDEVDLLGLAAMMVRDGHFERAEAILLKVDENDENIDKGRLYTLSGLLLLRRELYKSAKEKLQAAIDSGYEEPVLHVYIAQACYGLKEYDQTLAALDRAGEAGSAKPELFQLRAQCHWKSKRPDDAWTVIEQGQLQFPDEKLFERQKVFYLIELRLFQQAALFGEAYLAKPGALPEDYVAIGEALRLTGQIDKAIPMLEMAHLRHPDNMMILAELAHAYLDQGSTYVAASLFERAALSDPTSYLEAAELFRREGLYTRALFNNMQVIDQVEKAKQRLGILLQTKRYDLAVALEPRLSRMGLLKDDEIRYALAYSQFKLGHFEKAETHLKHITRSDLFHSATELRKAMQSCKDIGWECY